MTRVAPVLVVLLTTACVTTAYAQPETGSGTGSSVQDAAKSGKSALGSSDFGDDVPATEHGPAAATESNGKAAGNSASAQAAGMAAVGGAIVAGGASGALGSAKLPPAALVDPQALPIKQDIQAALAKGDEPAAHQLMSNALQRFPDDPELKDARSSMWTHLPAGKAQAIIDTARADIAKLFGRQWIPGQTDGEEVGIMVDGGPRTGSRMFGGSGSAVTKALGQGYAAIDRGDPALAEQMFSKAIKRHEDSAALYYARGMARGLSGNFKGADGDSLRAVTLSREEPVTLSQRATLMMEMGRRSEAFSWANRALEGNPKDADALAIRGRYLWKDQRCPDQALEDLRKAALIDPGRYQEFYQEGSRRIYGERAVASLGKGDLKEAFVDANRVLESDAGNADAHLVRGMVYWKLGKVEETIKDTTLALKANPRSTWALFHRGLAMEALGQRSRAIADLKRAAAINPAKFGPLLDKLLQAQREGRTEPVWPKEGAAVAASR